MHDRVVRPFSFRHGLFDRQVLGPIEHDGQYRPEAQVRTAPVVHVKGGEKQIVPPQRLVRLTSAGLAPDRRDSTFNNAFPYHRRSVINFGRPVTLPARPRFAVGRYQSVFLQKLHRLYVVSDDGAQIGFREHFPAATRSLSKRTGKRR